MEADDFEIYPIQHKGMVYNIITPFDMTFVEVHAVLDWLIDRNAFRPTADEASLGPGHLYTCAVEGAVFELDVQGYEVVLYRRSPPP